MGSDATAPQTDTVDAVLCTLRAHLPAQRPLPLHEPSFAGNEWALVKDCLDSGWVSSVGAYVDRLEKDLADYTGIGHAVATVNGTAALHTCLMLAGVQAGDEVLLPALTFVGTANPVAAMGAIPHFVDSETESLGIDPVALAGHLDDIADRRADGCYNRRTGRPIRALVVVHILGHVADISALAELAARYRIELIEDAAEALGSWRDARHAGSWARLSALSFNGNKIITTGGGGAVLTDDPALAQRARHLTTTAKLPHPWAFEHDEVGYNYRMPNLNAALGVAQLQRLPELLADKRRLAEDYARAFKAIAGAELHGEPIDCRSNHWLNLILLDRPADRDRLLQQAADEGMLLRPFWTPLDRLPMYRNCPAMPLPVANDLFARGVCLPSSAQLATSGAWS